MSTTDPLNQPHPRIAANVMHFARLLRRAGLPVGPAETIAAQEALTRIDLASKTQARTALRTAMIHRHEHQEVFDQAFALFWRDPVGGRTGRGDGAAGRAEEAEAGTAAAGGAAGGGGVRVEVGQAADSRRTSRRWST